MAARNSSTFAQLSWHPTFTGIGGSQPQGAVKAIESHPVMRLEELTAGASVIGLAMEVAGCFELDADKARAIAAQVGKAVSKWRDEAARHGLTKPEIDRMASAFEHRDLEMARDG